MNNVIRVTLILLFYTNIYTLAETRTISFAQKQTHTLLRSNDILSPKPLVPFIDVSYIYTDVHNNKFMNSKVVKILEVPVVLTAVSLAMTSFKDRFYNIKNTYIPDFHKSYDDYTQYLPAAVMLGVKAFGIEGRSSWKRMLISDAFSIVTMATLVNGIKYTAKVQRPANGSYDAYPSGHTATAFMTATMLHKEYGQVNKWYSIGAYGTASLIGMTRVLNNKHWMNDVFFGAAIGILSVELGYLFTELILKDKGLNSGYERKITYYNEYNNPSFISLYTAVNILSDSFTSSDGTEVKLRNSGRFGLEGAWYMNKYIGFGAEVTISITDVQVVENQMGMISGLVGAYCSYPLSNKWRVGSKIIGGVDFVKQPKNKIVDFANYSTTVSTGLNILYLTNSNLGFKVFADYRHHFKLVNGRGFNELNLGVSIGLIFGDK